ERYDRAHVVFIEVTAPRVLEIKYADDDVLVDKRHAEFGTRLRIDHDVAGIFSDIGDQDCAFLCSGGADQSASEGNVMLQLDILLEAQGKAMLKSLASLVKKQDAEHLEINHAT